MARWNKSYEEAAAYYEKKATLPPKASYYGYAATKKTRMKQRQGLIDNGTYRDPIATSGT